MEKESNQAEYYGYAGQILYIDLTREEFRTEPLDAELVQDFIGGWGINVRLYYDYQLPRSDPFLPDNPIIIGVGVLVGTLTPGATKITATYKTPIPDEKNRHFIDCAVSGTSKFGLMLKRAGYDFVIITGKADEPVYLKIDERDIEIRSAENLWGKLDTYQTSDWLREKHGNCGVITIGSAGENLVRYAMAIVDYHRHLGRFGLGAVMGSKNLKGIVARGTKKIKVARPEEFNNLIKTWRDGILQSCWGFKEYLRKGINAGFVFQGPVAQEGTMPWSIAQERFGYERYLEATPERNISDVFCPVPCRNRFKIKNGKFKGLETFTGFWFEPARVGQRLELEDWREAIKLLDVCNRAGMCVFTTSQIVNWVTRLYQEGKISEKDVGMKLERNFEVYLQLFEMIAERRGLGDILADGWWIAARKLNLDPEEHIWGTGIIQGVDVIQDARTTTLHPQAFTHLTTTRPHHGGHQSLYTRPQKHVDFLRKDAERMGLTEEELERVFTPTPEYGPFNVGRYAKHVEDHMVVMNSLGECVIHALWGDLAETLDLRIIYSNIELLAEVYSLVTGIKTTPRELKKKGERIFNLYRILQIREGFDERGKPPKVWFIPRKAPDGTELVMMDYYRKKVISKEDLEKLLDDYYNERGWNQSGIPKEELLEEFNLRKFWNNSSF